MLKGNQVGGHQLDRPSFKKGIKLMATKWIVPFW
jgi:hypothetical protein